MADYTIRVEATTEEAEKKLQRVDDKVVKLEKGANININLPTVGQTLSTLQTVGGALAKTAKLAFDLSRKANIGPGAVVNDINDVFDLFATKGKQAVSLVETLGKATPTNILGNTFKAASEGATTLARGISNVGYEIFGVTQSVNILNQAFGGLFNDTIGREIKLQESLLRTRTTLVSTADVAVNGKRITDPYQALIALEKPIEKTLQNIRRRSLDIAGTTSDAIVQVFGVVASQVGAFGGSLKDAEDLAITFAGALGTIGMSDPMLATQEIRSILTGNIDQNSVLARSLGLTNEEVTKAKASAEGLVAFLTRRLGAFAAGQKIAAQGFAGIVSNIQEVREEASRTFGKPLLAPFLEGLTKIYERLQLVFKQILGIADGLGRIGTSVFTGITGGITAAPILAGFSQRDQLKAFTGVEAGIAKAAVAIQKAMDSVRPIIASVAQEAIKAVAMLSSGLLELAKGFAVFKFEQFKILAITVGNIGNLLNSTVVPALTAVLNLYGQILAMPVFQFLTQFTAQMQVLEKVGVLPLIRIAYYLAASVGSFKTAITWAKAFFNAIKIGATAVLDFAAGAISGVTGVISAVGKAIISGIGVAFQTIITITEVAIRQIGIKLQQIGTAVAQLGPRFAALGASISSVGAAFLKVDNFADKARLKAATTLRSAADGLDNFAAAGRRAAEQTKRLGTTVGDFLGAQLTKLGKGLLSVAGSMIKFQAWLLFWEVMAGAVTAGVTAIQRANKEATEQTKAEMAVKRLSTVYADLGENASGAAKALKAADEATVTNRIESVTKQYTELNEKLKELRSLEKPKNMGDRLRLMAAALNPQNFDIQPKTDKKGWAREKFGEALIRQRREEYIKLRKELNSLTEAEDRLKKNQKQVEDVQVLAKERKDIETAIGEYRKELTRELRDEEFRTAREVASLQQSLREEARRAERADLERTLTAQNQGLTGTRAQVAQILANYEKGLFDAQTEAQRRQFDIAEKRQNLEKALADYKIKTEEQTAKLRKRLGDYNKEVDDYITAAQRRRDAESLENAVKIASLRTEKVVGTPDEAAVWNNTAKQLGASATGLLALTRDQGVIAKVGLPVGRTNSVENLKPWMEKLLMAYPAFRSTNNTQILQALTGRAQLNGEFNPAGFAQANYNDASTDLNNSSFFVAKPPPPKPLRGFADFNKELAGYQQERRALGENLLKLNQLVVDTLNGAATAETIKTAIAELENTNYSGLPSVVTARDTLRDTFNEFKLLNLALASGKKGVNALTGALVKFDENALAAFDQFWTTFNATRKRQKQPLMSLDVIAKERTRLFDLIRDPNSPGLKENKKNPNKEAELVKAFYRGLARDRANVQAVVPLQIQQTQLQQINEVINQLLQLPLELAKTRTELISQLSTTIIGDDPARSRRFAAEQAILQQQLNFAASGADKTTQGQEILAKFAESTRKGTEELIVFESELRKTAERVAFARELAQTITDGYKQIFTAATNGGNINEAVTGLLNNVKDKIMGAFIDFATAPIKKALEDSLFKFLKVPSAEELFNKQKDAALLQAATQDLSLQQTQVNLLQQIASNTTPVAAPLPPSTVDPGPTSVPTQPFRNAMNMRVGDRVPAAQRFDTPSRFAAGTRTYPGMAPEIVDTEVLSNETLAASTALRQVTSQTQQLPPAFSNLQTNIGKLTGVLGGIAMGLSGAQQMRQGGTYNTLMGLAGVFGGIASVAGAFGSLGNLFGGGGGGGMSSGGYSVNGMGVAGPNWGLPQRAAGGPTLPGQPYLVGENGPELWTPPSIGRVIPNNQLPPESDAYGATQGYLEQLSMSRPSSYYNTPLRIESQVINGVEYATVDQLREAAQQAEQRGAERGAAQGQSRMLYSMRNNVKTRKSVGLA